MVWLLALHLDGLAGLDTVGRTIHDVAVDEDVTVHHELTSLSGGTGDAGTQHEVVKTDALEIGEHRVTGLAGGAGRLLVSGAKLLLGDAVLGAQTPLLAQTNRVIGFGATTGAAVLTGSVRALFEMR